LRGPIREFQLTMAGHTQHVTLIRTLTPRGRERVWLQCPACGRRCKAICLPPNDVQWGCRSCLSLSYEVQSLSPEHRLFRRVLRWDL
jgi:hypothetical protein